MGAAGTRQGAGLEADGFGPSPVDEAGGEDAVAVEETQATDYGADPNGELTAI